MKPQKPMTEEAKYEQQVQLEQELGHLQRQYKIMERDRKALSNQSGGKLAKQKKVIRILKNEQKNIINDFNVATAEGKIENDRAIARNLNTLLEEYDEFDERIKAEKTHLNEIDFQIRQVNKQVCDLASKQITDIQCQERILAGVKTVEALENKLDVQIKKFCTILAENKKLRTEIDHMLKERAHFNLLWEKLISNLNQGKKFMLDLIEQATIAYDQREEWCSKLQALRARAHGDFVLHSEEIRELQRKIDHDEKLQEFLNVKCQKRIMADLEAKELKKRQKHREEMQKHLEEYNEMLTQIYEFAGNEQVQEIAKQFRQQEVENFALFRYINEINKELEEMGDQIGHLHMDIDEQRALNDHRAQQQQQKLQDLEDELARHTKDADSAEAALHATEDKLSNLLSGIDRLFKICKCSNAPLLELLGNNTEIHQYNVMLYLQILEKRIGELILTVFYKEKLLSDKKKGTTGVIKTDGAPAVTHPIEDIVATQPCPLCVEHEQVSDVIDTLQHALNREEIQNKLQERLELPDGLERLHNVSACHLPESRQIIQRRYQ